MHLDILSTILLEASKRRYKYTVDDAVRMVMANGLCLTKALCECLNSCCRQHLRYVLIKVD